MAGKTTKSIYSEDLADELCERLVTSKGGLNEVCKAKDMPELRTVFRWIVRHPEFAIKYAAARDAQAQYLLDEIIPLADSATPQNAHAVRIMVDTRKWIVSKLLSTKYGDRIDGKVDHNVNVSVSVVDNFAKPKVKITAANPKVIDCKAKITKLTKDKHKGNKPQI